MAHLFPYSEPDDRLEAFFLDLAKGQRMNLRLTNTESGGGFEFKPITYEGANIVAGEMEVELHRFDTNSQKAVRLDRVSAHSLHEVLEKMEVPHEYNRQPRSVDESEISMSVESARKYLEAAFERRDAEREAASKLLQQADRAFLGEPEGISGLRRLQAERKRKSAPKSGPPTRC